MPISEAATTAPGWSHGSMLVDGQQVGEREKCGRDGHDGRPASPSSPSTKFTPVSQIVATTMGTVSTVPSAGPSTHVWRAVAGAPAQPADR